MRKHIQHPDTKKTDELYLRIFMFLLISLILGFGNKINAQVVRNPVSEVSETAKHYIYTYKLSQTQKKDIEYIIVKASKGDIKTVFNACDVCYNAHKGYSQNGTQLRCNNCGNKFNIDQLGAQGTGGTCNPGYLPHTLEGSDVVFNVADLVKGAYFFLPQDISEVDYISKDDNSSPSLFIKNGDLNIKMPADSQRNFLIATLNGQACKSFDATSKDITVNISDFSSGIYLLRVEESGRVYSKVFCVFK